MFSLAARTNITGCRGERIRTSGLHVPNVARYPAALRPDSDIIIDVFHFFGKNKISYREAKPFS